MTRLSTDRERALAFAWIANKLAGRPDREVLQFVTDELGIVTSQGTLERVIRKVRHHNPHKRNERAECAVERDAFGGADGLRPAVWTDWLRVREEDLDLRKFLIRIPNDGFPLPGAFEALEQIKGIRSIIETREDRELLAIAILAPDEDEESLRACVAEHLPGRSIRLHQIIRESDAPTVLTWLELARHTARGGT